MKFNGLVKSMLLSIQILLCFHVRVYGSRILTLPFEKGSCIRQKVETEAETVEALKLEENLNLRPLIGILSQPIDDTDVKNIPLKDDRRWTNMSYIAASYVKFVEAGGARAVPLLYNEPEDILEKKFAAINGILFPGGDANLQPGPFYNTAEKLFKMALKANDEGDYFPVFGTCLGFELLSVIVSQDHHLLEGFKALGEPGPLLFSSELAKQQSIFAWFSQDILNKVTHENLAMENHKWGVSPKKFLANDLLSEFFEVLTTTPDQENQPYVSTIQGRKYPVTGVQWHPEKNAFEWGGASIPHNADAVQITQMVANFFVSEAHKSSHRPSSVEEENTILIYNYTPLFSGIYGPGSFDQTYTFLSR